MPLYLDVLMLLNFGVDLLLLVGTNRLAGCPAGLRRALPAAALGGIYGGVCVLKGLGFLGGLFFRIAALALMALIAFGHTRDALRRGALFIILSMALGGVAQIFNRGGFFGVILSAAVISAICLFGFRGKLGQQFVQVSIRGCGFLALVDTGNSLTDPLTGQQVLVVSPAVGEKLLRLERERLTDPLAVMTAVPGMRLLSFQAVGRSSGLLPAKRFEDVKIGAWRGSCLVAFSPNEIGRGRPYEALTGGMV